MSDPEVLTDRDQTTDARGRARSGFDAVQSDPTRAGPLLRAVLADPAAPDDALVLAGWGLGRLLHDEGEISQACRVLDDTVRRAGSAGLVVQQAHARSSWAVCLQAAGDPSAALSQMDLAEPHLGGADLGRLLMQRGFVEMHQGQHAAAIVHYDRALPLLRRGGDRLAEARLLTNRGVALVQQGRLRSAQNDFERAGEAAAALGQHLLVAGALHNLGWLHGRLGRVPHALEHFERARVAYAALGSPGRLLAALDTDHCEVLLSSSLSSEADEVATRVVERARATGNALQLVEGLLLRTRALLLLGRRSDATLAAAEAERLARSSGRLPYAAFASYLGVQAGSVEVDASGPSSVTDRLDDIAAALARFGWWAEEAQVRIVAGRVALEAGDRATAHRQLEAVAPARRKGAARLRADGWHAAALLHVAAGDLATARRDIGHGLRVIERHRASLGASDLRAHASTDGHELACLGIQLAVERGRPREVFRWAERWRAGALTLAPAQPPDDRRLADDLAVLRQLHQDSRDSSLAGEDVGLVHVRIAAMERAVTARSRTMPGSGDQSPHRGDLGALRAQLGSATLVEFVETGDLLHAVVVTAQRVRLVDLATTDAVRATHDHLLFALRRLSALPADHRRAEQAGVALRHAAGEMAGLLLDPLHLALGGDVVLVPTGTLHGLVWSAVTAGRFSSVTLAPSAGWWSGGDDPDPRGHVTIAAGPDLPASARELREITAMYPGARALSGADATAENVIDALGGAALAHIAAHGTFRSDNPMFSSLRLADGPLCTYDLQRLDRPPRTVVMTACDAGRSGVLAGDELLGAATALLALGVRTVIAPLVPVPDEATAQLAVSLHRELSHGVAPAMALTAAAERARRAGGPHGLAVASAFHCIGTASARSPVSAPPLATL